MTEFFISNPPPAKGNVPAPAQPGPSRRDPAPANPPAPPNRNPPHPAPQQSTSNLPKLAPRIPAKPSTECVTVLILDHCQMVDIFLLRDPLADLQRTSSFAILHPTITPSVRSASDLPTFAFRSKLDVILSYNLHHSLSCICINLQPLTPLIRILALAFICTSQLY